MPKTKKDEQIENLLVDLVRENIIDIDSVDVTRVTLSFLKYFPDRRKAKKVANCKKFDEYWDNLVLNYYTKDRKICIPQDFDTLSFLVMILVAEGVLQVVNCGG